MKKILCVLMCMTMIAGSAAVYADEIDLSGKSVEELLEIREAVDDALYEQNGMATIQYGTYVAGKDIAPGSYMIHVHRGKGVGEDESAGMYYTIWKYENAKAECEQAYRAYVEAYQAAEKAEEAGKEAEYPAQISMYDYCVIEEELVKAGGTFHVDLAEGSVLEITDWCEAAVGTIEKQTGLFME